MIFPFHQRREHWPADINTAYTAHLVERGWPVLCRLTASRIQTEPRPFTRELLWDHAVDTFLYGIRKFEPAITTDGLFETCLQVWLRKRWISCMRAQKRNQEPLWLELLVPPPTPNAPDPVVVRELYQMSMQALGETDRAVLELWLKGYTFDEIGERRGHNNRRAHAIKDRALGRLRQRLLP